MSALETLDPKEVTYMLFVKAPPPFDEKRLKKEKSKIVQDNVQPEHL